MAGILRDSEPKPDTAGAMPAVPWLTVPDVHGEPPVALKPQGGAPRKPLLAPLYDMIKSVMGSGRAQEAIAEAVYPDDLNCSGPENVKKRIQREGKRHYGLLSVIPKRFFLDD